jgi:xanthine dehydrogenase accessory factor
VSGTSNDLRERAERLRADRRPFVTATVVRADKPTSAKAGDSALVLADGTIIGFVGGECASASVLAQSLATLDTGDPVLLRISPDAGAPGAEPHEPGAGTVTVHNPCLSGGALDIFLEPFLPPAVVVVHGDAPIARAVRELAGWLGFDSCPWEDGGPAGTTAVVPAGTAAVIVASHGGAEHAVIRAALHAGVPYIGLIASTRRGEAVVDGLCLDTDDRARVHTPAGIDIGSRTPQEVALSVLAEVVSARRRKHHPFGDARQLASNLPNPPEALSTFSWQKGHNGRNATDPVCGMDVAAVHGSRHLDHDGVRYWFCGSGCEDAFRADPGAFLRT